LKPKADIRSLARNVYSQTGEDGVIDWVFSRMTPRHRICVEFGAWDGRNLSNTFNLVENKDWSAVYIEADPKKFEALKRTAAAYPKIAPVCCFVEASGENSLDRILERQGIPDDFDLLSIDVDGPDYDIWESVTRYRPGLVVIEHNPTFPVGTEFIDRGAREFIGSSATSLNILAAKKGYGQLGCTRGNSFFLRNDLFDALDARPQTDAEAFDDSLVCNVYLNHAGEFVFSNPVVAARLRGVAYASRVKTWTRRLLGMPTFYVLGQPHVEAGAVMKLLRRLAAWLRG
jgi:hypothetical protein